MYENFTLKDLYLTWDDNQVCDFLKEGLKRNNEPMTMSAICELMNRGNSDMMENALYDAFLKDQVFLGTQFVVTLGNLLFSLGARDKTCKELGEELKTFSPGPGAKERIIEILTTF